MTEPNLPSRSPGHARASTAGQPFAATLLRLLTWLSPAFPTGAYAHSHGIEWAVESRDIRDAATLLIWLGDVLRHGAGRSDTILMRHAYRADTLDALTDLAELAAAAQPGRERRAESLGQGGAFTLAAAVWGSPLLATLADRVGAPGIAYPIALGALTRAHGVGEDAAALGLLHAFTANLVSAAVRLVPLGQTAGLRVLAALEPVQHEVAAATLTATLDDLGGACFRSDIAAMRHETQHTRLFRT